MKFANVNDIYNKYRELKREDVESLKNWVRKQPHLPEVKELHLILFLHSCYYSLEQTKATIDNFYTYRAHCPEFFANRNPNKNPLQLFLDKILFVELPKLTPEGYKIFFCKLMSSNVNDYALSDHAKIFDMCTMQWLNEEGPSKGFVILVDLNGFTLGHLRKMNLVTMKKILTYLQEGLPVHLQAIHLVNLGNIVDHFMVMVKPFLKKEVADRFFFYDVICDKLYPNIPKECLPEDYGGNADSIAKLHEQMKKHFMENATFFEEDEKYIANESKRLGKPRSVNDVFGVEGSFKKLDID